MYLWNLFWHSFKKFTQFDGAQKRNENEKQKRTAKYQIFKENRHRCRRRSMDCADDCSAATAAFRGHAFLSSLFPPEIRIVIYLVSDSWRTHFQIVWIEIDFSLSFAAYLFIHRIHSFAPT